MLIVMYHSCTSQTVDHRSYHHNSWSTVNMELNINYSAVVVASMLGHANG